MLQNSSTIFTKSLADTLDSITFDLNRYVPLVLTIIGLIGFLGNSFTYLQSELRSNTCAIYSFCSSIADILTIGMNTFPNYLSWNNIVQIPWTISSSICKLQLFLLVFLPHLSTNFLLMTLIDRFASTCRLGSIIRQVNRLKMVWAMIILTILTSLAASIYTPIVFDIVPGFGCSSTNPNLTSILYFTLIGIPHPTLMLIFLILMNRNLRLSRQRVVG